MITFRPHGRGYKSGPAPWSPLQAGYFVFAVGATWSSMRIPWRQGMYRSYSYTNRAPLRSRSVANVTSADDADNSNEP